MADRRFTLRVAVKTLGEEPVAGLEAGCSFNIGMVCVTLDHRGRYLVLKAGDFATEEDAAQFLPPLKAGLWNLAIEYNIAFIPDFEQREITWSANPELAGRNLSASFGLPELGPVHGLADEGGIVIFPSEENIRFIGGGEITARVSTNLKDVVRVLSEGIVSAQLSTFVTDEKFSTAFDLYLGHFYERSIHARFLSLIMTLEVLAPVTEKHAAAQELLTGWGQVIKERLSQAVGDDERDALEALSRELEFRKETSIRRRVRRLILDEAPIDDLSKTALARQVVRAYDLRGGLVHSGSVDENELREAHDITLRAVKLILSARLGLAGLG